MCSTISLASPKSKLIKIQSLNDFMSLSEREENDYYDALYKGVCNYDPTMDLESKQIYHQLVLDGRIVC